MKLLLNCDDLCGIMLTIVAIFTFHIGKINVIRNCRDYNFNGTLYKKIDELTLALFTHRLFVLPPIVTCPVQLLRFPTNFYK